MLRNKRMYVILVSRKGQKVARELVHEEMRGSFWWGVFEMRWHLGGTYKVNVFITLEIFTYPPAVIFHLGQNTAGIDFQPFRWRQTWSAKLEPIAKARCILRTSPAWPHEVQKLPWKGMMALSGGHKEIIESICASIIILRYRVEGVILKVNTASSGAAQEPLDTQQHT